MNLCQWIINIGVLSSTCCLTSALREICMSPGHALRKVPTEWCFYQPRSKSSFLPLFPGSFCGPSFSTSLPSASRSTDPPDPQQWCVPANLEAKMNILLCKLTFLLCILVTLTKLFKPPHYEQCWWHFTQHIMSRKKGQWQYLLKGWKIYRF